MIGIPVYFHYCGGELEGISYVVKSDSCCGEEEEAEADAKDDNGCCKDENLVLKSNIDFTIKNFSSYAFVKTSCDLFYISLPFSTSTPQTSIPVLYPTNLPPPEFQHDLLISTSVLRI